MRLVLGFLLLTALIATCIADGPPIDVGGGVINPRTGEFFPQVGGDGFINRGQGNSFQGFQG
jgi:hypothetical protein